jgi:uncharacterized protein
MEKLLIISTHATDNAERATVPFVIGVTATISDMQPTIILQMEGAWLAKEGHATLVRDPAFPPLADLMKDFMDGGGRVLVCSLCARKRGIKKEDMVKGVIVVSAPSMLKEIADASKILTY